MTSGNCGIMVDDIGCDVENVIRETVMWRRRRRKMAMMMIRSL